MLANQNKALQAQLNEMKRKQAESDCKVWMEWRGRRKKGDGRWHMRERWIDRERNIFLVQLNEL